MVLVYLSTVNTVNISKQLGETKPTNTNKHEKLVNHGESINFVHPFFHPFSLYFPVTVSMIPDPRVSFRFSPRQFLHQVTTQEPRKTVQVVNPTSPRQLATAATVNGHV
jgi:hypothetical protein